MKMHRILEPNLGLKAIIFAKGKHYGQKDDCGKDYFESHITQVHHILLQVTEDPEILAAAWLHDTLEDTQTTYEELVEHFGKRIADVVNEVTHEGKKDQKGFYFPRLKSKDAILIKFAESLLKEKQILEIRIKMTTTVPT